jgi:hypothetical protein
MGKSAGGAAAAAAAAAKQSSRTAWQLQQKQAHQPVRTSVTIMTMLAGPASGGS